MAVINTVLLALYLYMGSTLLMNKCSLFDFVILVLSQIMVLY